LTLVAELPEIWNGKNKGKCKLKRENDKKYQLIQKNMRLSTFSPQFIFLQSILKTEAASTFELPEIYTISAQ
jgi:hypothetical protein